jgi:hypothetical protein
MYDEEIEGEAGRSEYLIDQQINIVALCMNLIDIANTNTYEGVELDLLLRKNLEPFFKDLFYIDFYKGLLN